MSGPAPPREASPVSSFTVRLADTAPDRGRLRVAVKDIIDMVGLTTTCGSRVLASTRAPAAADAACLAGIRAEEAAGRVVIVGRTNLHELAFGVSGVNPWYGTPVNPLDPRLVPGGSSSGSAAAIGAGLADVALGTDTGGSIRIPAACCGVVGLKTTTGRVSLAGVDPLGPSLDTVGPMGATVDAVGRGMQLLEPGFEWRDTPPATRIGRFRPRADPWIDRALDARLAAWAAAAPGRSVVDLDLDHFDEATEALGAILAREAWTVHAELWTRHASELSPDVADRLEAASHLPDADFEAATRMRARWSDGLARVLGGVDLVALPVLASAPPPLTDAARVSSIRYTGPFNLSGGPALALPVRSGRSGLPASLQLVGPAGAEAMVLRSAAEIESLAPGPSPDAPAGERL